jgi:hypothetical protein
MPRKVFTAGEVLAAADVNEFLQDQAVMSFAGTAARGSAIGTAVEGMVTYLNDSNSLSVNNGTDWTIDRTIQVFAGTAARGSAIPSPVQGMYAHLNDTDTLTYYNGSAWVGFGQSGLTLVKTQTIGSAVTSVTVNDAFSADYEEYRILISGGSASGSSVLGFRVGSQTSGYIHTYIFSDYSAAVAASSTLTGTSLASAGMATANGINMNIDINGPFLSKTTAFQTGIAGLGSTFAGRSHGWLDNTTSYTSFTILSDVAMTGGLIKVYGYGKA